MTQFIPRFSSSSPTIEKREPDMKLSLSPNLHGQNPAQSVYHRNPQEHQKIKKLSFWNNQDEKIADDDEWKERQSPVPFILTMAILVIASTSLWFIYRWISGDNQDPPPVITPTTTLIKVRPHNPGGMMIPHQDKLVYGRFSQDGSQPIEQLLPAPEQPIILQPQTEPYPQDQQPSEALLNAPHPLNPNIPPQATPPSYEQGQQSSSFSEHHSPSAQPSEQMSYPAPHQQPSTPSSLPPAPRQETSKISTIEAIKPAAEMKEPPTNDALREDGKDTLDQLIAKVADTPSVKTPQKSNSKLRAPIAMKSVKHKVQIASLPSRSLAENEMKRLYTQHTSFLTNKPWGIQKVSSHARTTTYRLVVGAFPHQNAAEKFCKQLRLKKVGCQVLAPSSE